MLHRLINLALVLAILVGGILAGRTGWERSRLARTYQRLSQKTGDLPIGEPSLVHVKAIETGDPMHFAWRVYLPKGCKRTFTYGGGGGSAGSYAWPDSTEFIARVRFREDEQGNLHVYTRFASGSSRMQIGDRALTELLRGRWGRLRVEQIGAEVTALPPEKPAVLLRLALADDMREEAARKLPPDELKRSVPVLFNVELSPDGP